MSIFVFAFLIAFLFTIPAFANPACAVCTVAVGAALGISRELGVDDTVIGVFFGALLMLIVFWLIKFCAYKKWHFKGLNLLLFVLTFSLVIPLYTMDYIPYGARTLFGVDSFLLSIIVGAIIIWITDIWYRKMKENNGGHAHFPFEKVVIPVVCLILAGVTFYAVSEAGLIKQNITLPDIEIDLD